MLVVMQTRISICESESNVRSGELSAKRVTNCDVLKARAKGRRA
jgi:hypothetical protein